MKTMKKLAAVLMAVAIIFSLAATAMAADPDGSIKVTNTVKGQTYTVYKIFDLESYEPDTAEADREDNAHSYRIDNTSPWYAFVTGEGAGASYVTITDSSEGNRQAGYVEWVENADPAEFAKLALAYAEEKSIASAAASQTAAEDNQELTFSGLDLGYYLIDSSLGALCALDTTNPNATVIEKNAKPTVKKTVTNVKDDDSPSIGEAVKYEITVHVVKGAEGYVLHDTMSTGLSFNNDVKVFDGDAEVDAANYSVKTGDSITDGCSFEVEFTQSYLNTLSNSINENGKDLKVTYSATINENVLETKIGENKTVLTYGDGNTTEESKVQTPVYEFDLVKTNSENSVLPGATFELHEGEATLSLVPVNEAKTIYRVAKSATEQGAVTEFTAGNITIQGLGNGTYSLVEKAAPAGYNLMKDPKDVTIGGADLKATVEADTWTEGGVQVVNYTGQELPSTGGIGTTLFYVFGGLLVVTAGVLLVTKRRMNVTEE